jgi:hypothetical protein
VQYATLNYFDPQPVTPNADYQENTGTIREHFGIGGGVLTSTFSGTRFVTNVTPQTPGEMVLSPVGNSGRYFGQQSREPTRFQWMETWKPSSLKAVRLSFTVRNLTNHTNPLQIHNDVADPQFGTFFGNYGRH